MSGNVLVENTERKYISLVTDVGNELMMQAVAEGKKVAITEFAVGDGGGEFYKPTTDMTALKNEQWRGPINTCKISSEAPNVLEVTGICPGTVGGFTIREIGVFDADGHMISVSNCPAIPKITASDGSINELNLVHKIALVNGDVVELVIDPNIVTATKADIEALRNEISKIPKVTIGTKDTPLEENEIRLIVDEMPY